MPDDKTHRMNLVMPIGLHKRLTELAKAERRTLTNYLLVELEKLASEREKVRG